MPTPTPTPTPTTPSILGTPVPSQPVTSLPLNELKCLAVTIELFEGIIATAPGDIKSLQILQEAYVRLNKLSRETWLPRVSKLLARAYVERGRLLDAIDTYQFVLQEFPNDAEAQEALQELLRSQPQAATETTVVALTPEQQCEESAKLFEEIIGYPTDDNPSYLQILSILVQLYTILNRPADVARITALYARAILPPKKAPATPVGCQNSAAVPGPSQCPTPASGEIAAGGH